MSLCQWFEANYPVMSYCNLEWCKELTKMDDNEVIRYVEVVCGNKRKDKVNNDDKLAHRLVDKSIEFFKRLSNEKKL